MQFKNNTIFALAASSDGSASTAIVVGFEALKKALCAELWFGPIDEALQDPLVLSCLNQANPEHEDSEWQNDFKTCSIGLEQAAIDIFVIDPADIDKGLPKSIMLQSNEPKLGTPDDVDEVLSIRNHIFNLSEEMPMTQNQYGQFQAIKARLWSFGARLKKESKNENN